jgi:hypothetical protein
VDRVEGVDVVANLEAAEVRTSRLEDLVAKDST